MPSDEIQNQEINPSDSLDYARDKSLRARSQKFAVSKNTRLSTLIISALVVGFFVRIAPIFHQQIYFWFDQGLDTILVKQLVVDHRLSLVGRYSGLAGVLMGPFWTWLLALPFAISGGNPLASTVFFSLLGTISALAVYKFLRPVSQTAAIFSLLGILFAPILITYSHLVASPHPLSFLFIFYVWFLHKIVVYRQSKYWLPLLFLVGLFFQLEIGFAIFTLPAVVITVIIFRQWRVFLTKYFFLGCIALFLTFVPQIIFDLRHDFLISRGVLSVFFGNNNLYNTHDSLLVRFLERAKSFRDDFVLMALFVRPGILAGFTLTLSVVGWLLAFKHRLIKPIYLFKILVAIIATFYVGFSLYPGPLWTWYRAGLPVVYIIIIALGLSTAWERIRLFRPVIFILLSVIVFQGINPQRLVDNLSGRPINDNAILQNQIVALDYIYRRANGRQFSYFAYTPPVYDYIWQYNFWWYGQRKYGYLPRNWQMGIPLLGTGEQGKPPMADEGLFFLIIEPNSERPWEPDGWKKTYIKYGNVVETSELPGKIIIEQRITN